MIVTGIVRAVERRFDGNILEIRLEGLSTMEATERALEAIRRLSADIGIPSS